MVFVGMKGLAGESGPRGRMQLRCGTGKNVSERENCKPRGGNLRKKGHGGLRVEKKTSFFVQGLICKVRNQGRSGEEMASAGERKEEKRSDLFNRRRKERKGASTKIMFLS